MKKKLIFIHESSSVNIVCEMAAILSWGGGQIAIYNSSADYKLTVKSLI